MRVISPSVLSKLKKFGTTVKVYLSLRDNDYTFVSGEWVNSNALEDVGVALMFKKDIGADFLRSNAQKVEMEIKGAFDLVGKEVVAEFRLEWRKGDGTTESATVPLGVFMPKEWEINAETGNTVIKEGYDRLLNLQEEYSEEFSDSLTFPITVEDFLLALADYKKINIDLPDNDNLEKELDYDIYLGIGGYTYRAVLDDILQGCGLSARMRDNTLMVYNPVDDSDVLDLVETDFSELKIGDVQEGFNVLNLAREPQHDNYFYPLGLPEDKVEMVIENNLLSDIRGTGSVRAEYAPAIFDEISQIGYRMFASKTWGFPQLEALDRVSITGIEGVDDFGSYVMRSTMVWDGGLTQTIEAVETQYLKDEYVLITDREKAGIRTEIIVNKQEGEIQLLNQKMETVATIPRQATAPDDPEVNDLWLNTTDNVIYIYDGIVWQPTSLKISDLANYYTKGETTAEILLHTDAIQLSVEEIDSKVAENEGRLDGDNVRIEELQSNLASLELRADGLELGVESIGGSNLFKNSAGLKGRIDEWQVFDINGNLVDVKNDGVAVLTSDTEENTESGGGIRIEEQFIVQSVPTIAGNPYTFYCRFKKLLDLDLTITGVTGGLKITAGDYVDEQWAVYKYTFTANSDMTEIKISNLSSGVGAYAILSDMVLKLGFVSGWIQAPNEVYGKNYRFDKDGFNVTSLTDKFKAVLDNVKLGIYDTSAGTDRIMALFSKDEGLITKLIAQDEFTLQRYQNEEKATRFIPTSKGCMITVND